MGKDYVCNKCGYQWASRKGQGEPAYCPRCASKKIQMDEQDENLINQDKNKPEITTCDYCGRKIKADELKGYCNWQKGGFFKKFCRGKPSLLNGYYIGIKRKELCNKCARECKKCGKIFCPEHIDTHNC